MVDIVTFDSEDESESGSREANIETSCSILIDYTLASLML